MCTIGAVRNKDTDTSYFFKNIDQVTQMDYAKPIITRGKQYRYFKFPAESNPKRAGLLAGVNEKGFVLGWG